jgi:hypothetical protein
LIVLGFSFIALSAYLIPLLFAKYYYVNFTLFFVGLGLVRYGLKYRNRDKINKEIKEEHEYWKRTPWSNGRVLGLIGLITVFTSLGVGFAYVYVVKNLALFGLFFLLLAIGAILLFTSNTMMREEIRKEREKKMYSN